MQAGSEGRGSPGVLRLEVLKEKVEGADGKGALSSQKMICPCTPDLRDRKCLLRFDLKLVDFNSRFFSLSFNISFSHSQSNLSRRHLTKSARDSRFDCLTLGFKSVCSVNQANQAPSQIK